jgi:hypothetical protein
MPPPFLILALDVGELSVSRPGRSTPGGKCLRRGGTQAQTPRCELQKNLFLLAGN